jgi:branched-chain amino acid transport system substrate-binding protein
LTRLRAALVTPLSGPLSHFGQASATGLALWAEHAARLPPPWTGVDLTVRDTAHDPAAAMRATAATRPDLLFGPYGSGPMLNAARVTERVIWNHGGASSRLSRPAFPRVINVLSPASSYFTGVLQAVRAVDRQAALVSILHASSGFGRDVAAGAASSAATLNFAVQAVAYGAYQAAEAAASLPDAEILLVAGNFSDELAVAPLLLTRTWRAAAFVGAGVEEVLAPLDKLREGLLGPAQWMASAAIEPDEGPGSDWFVEKYRSISGIDPPYPAAQAFAAGLLCARCLRDGGGVDDTTQLARAYQLDCTTLYGRFRLDPLSGLQAGHQVLIAQWQNGIRRVVWPPEQAERPLRYPLSLGAG